MAIALRLFGDFSLERAREGWRWSVLREGQALLAYVAVNRDTSHSPEALPHCSGRIIPRMLHWPIFGWYFSIFARRLEAGGLPMLLIDRRAFVRPRALLTVDTARFSSVLAKVGNIPSGQQASIPDLQDLALPLPCIVAEFLAGFALPDARTSKPGCRCAVRAWHRDAWRFWPAYRMPI